MTTTTTSTSAPRPPVLPAEPPRPDDPYARIRGWIDPPEGFTSLALISLLLLITVWTVEGAGWVREMPQLEPVALIGIGLAYLLAKIRIPAVLLHPVGLVVGAIVIIADAVSITAGETVAERLRDLALRMAQWWEIASSGGISSDPVPFIFQVIVLTWVVAYASSWAVFRSQQIWLGIVPAGIALLVNLTYLPGRFTGHFVVFVIVAMLLAARLTLVQKLLRWRNEGARFSRWQELSYVTNALWAALATLMIAFMVPSFDAAGPVAAVWERYGGPWRDFEREFDRLFASVSSGKAVPLHSFGRQMPFRGAVNFGGLPLGGSVTFGRDTVMTVQSDTPAYWRAAAYDTYTAQGWTSSARVHPPVPKELQRDPSEPYEGRKQVTITVEINVPTDVVFSAGIPLTSDLDAANDLIPPALYVLPMNEPYRGRPLPADLRNVLPDLPARLRALGRLPSEDDVQRLLPPDLTVRSIERRGAQVDQIAVTRHEPFPPDSLGLRAQQRLNRGQKYTVTSWVSVAAEQDLKLAGRDYPGWVLDRYLALPRDLPARIRDLAREWTVGLDNPYDMALAIEQRLRTEYTYSLDITQPPQGRDGVEHFLFYIKKGYCDYYASAMAVMLRSLGVPTRVAVGYVSGDYDSDTATFTVREPHAHAWPEVYFPKYGWVEFNPTPAWPSVWRPSNTLADSGFTEEDDLGLPYYNPEEEFLEQQFGSSAGAAGASQGIDWTAILTPIAYALAGLAFLAVSARTAWLWGLRGLNPAAQSYEKVTRLATLAGHRPRPFETPAEFAARLGGIVPAVAGPVAGIAASYARHRFSPRPVSPEEAQAVEDQWRAARKDLVFRALRWKPKPPKPKAQPQQ